MNAQDFNKIVEARLQSCRDLMIPKGEEYARNGDRLHNFKTAGRVAGTTPEKALLGMYLKHLVSVMDIIDDLDNCKLPKPAVLNEKITDSINYHLLLEGLIREREQEKLAFGKLMQELRKPDERLDCLVFKPVDGDIVCTAKEEIPPIKSLSTVTPAGRFLASKKYVTLDPSGQLWESDHRSMLNATPCARIPDEPASE